MKSVSRPLVLIFCLSLLSVPASASDAIGDIVKAQVILGKVMEITSKFQSLQPADIVVPQPLANTKGRYLLPYTNDGALTEWANKALSVQVGAAVGSKVGEEAGKRLTAKVPFGGLASGLAKKKGKEMGAVAAVGGEKFMRQTSSRSFNNLDDYAVYLHVTHAGTAGYDQALAAAMAVYPELEAGYQPAIQNAYKRAQQGR